MALPDRELYFKSQVGGRVGHAPFFIGNANGTYSIPVDVKNLTGLEMCKYEMTVSVTRRVTATWDDENSQHYLMTRRENTIFYHENSVEIPKEEPFLCSNTQACDDFQDVKAEVYFLFVDADRVEF